MYIFVAVKIDDSMKGIRVHDEPRVRQWTS